MYEPEVTVIIPTYNIVEQDKADDFTLLINLLDRQTYPYVNILVMDNASTDETIELLKDYKNSGFLNFFSAPDNGKFDAMNKGIMKVKSKYLSFLSCDDFIHDITAFTDIVNLMEEDDADFCIFPSYCCQPDGSVFLFNPSIMNVFQVMPCSRQATVYKREAIEKLNYFDSKFKLLADYDLILRMVLNDFNGTYFDGNVLTYKIGEQVLNNSRQVEAECNHIFYKNYKNLYPLSEEAIDRIVKLSEIPKPLLDKLAQKFPSSTEDFYSNYEQMYNMRMEAVKAQR